MSRVTMIHHINIQVSDREKTREWYEKVLGAEFLDRGPTLNRQQLQFRIGNAEVHTNDTPNPVQVAAVHFAAEIADWDELIAHLDGLGIPYSMALRRPPGSKSSLPGDAGNIRETITPTSPTPTATSSNWSTILSALPTPKATRSRLPTTPTVLNG